MNIAAFTSEQIGGMSWNALMAVAGITLAITGPKYLHLIDKGFPQKSRTNPEAAAKQVKTFRLLGVCFAFVSLALLLLSLFGGQK
jgi:hypothetical protein